jgi:ADP-ribose pyrophosphatase
MTKVEVKKPPKLKKSKVIYKGFFNLRIDLLESSAGDQTEYSVLEIRNDATAILAETSEGHIVVLKEFRYPTEKHLLGCPGGLIDSKESPLAAAKRELLEETGYTADEFIVLNKAYPFPGVTGQKIYFVLAKGARKISNPMPEPFEFIQTEEISKEDLYKKIKNGQEIDGVLCTALFFRSIHI